ncbi:Tripeptidyl aminopeptidase precursor [Corynebacterium capitovis DSM 44611]|nr:Tripeptidyl aminopeptidase precursor [Corynebacterium capitovis DSM 44611]
MARKWPLVASVLSCALISGATSVARADEPSHIQWGACPPTVNVDGAQCGSVEAPMRYDDPAGPTISLGVMKIPAADPSERRGALFGNPGGPGVDAYSYFGTAKGGFEWPEEIRNEWDLITVQPRGLQHSTPLECEVIGGASPLDVARTVVDSYVNSGAQSRAACQGSRPGYPETITTDTNARDWDTARQALGYDSISLMGLSYGTYLASAYASLFPERTDRVVLDSAMDPSTRWDRLLLDQQGGYERTLNDYFGFVADNDATYHMGDTPLKAYQYWSARIVAETGTNPTVTPPPARVGDLPAGLGSSGQAGADALTATGKARVEGEGIVSRMLNPGSNQINSPLLAATKAMLPQAKNWDSIARMTNGTLEAGATELSPELSDEIIGMQLALFRLQSVQICNENITPPDYSQLPAAVWSSFVTGDIFTSPHAVIGSGIYCNGAAPVAAEVPLSGATLTVRPLQINATGDPQTVYAGRTTIADAMGSHLVTVHGPGHGHVALGNPVVDDLVVDYLRTGQATATDAPGYFEAQKAG